MDWINNIKKLVVKTYSKYSGDDTNHRVLFKSVMKELVWEYMNNFERPENPLISYNGDIYFVDEKTIIDIMLVSSEPYYTGEYSVVFLRKERYMVGDLSMKLHFDYWYNKNGGSVDVRELFYDWVDTRTIFKERLRGGGTCQGCHDNYKNSVRDGVGKLQTIIFDMFNDKHKRKRIKDLKDNEYLKMMNLLRDIHNK